MRRFLSPRFWLWGVLSVLLAAAAAQWLQWSHWRYELQRQLDDVAESALAAAGRGEDPLARAQAELAAYGLTRTAVVEYPPRGGLFAGDPSALRVRAGIAKRPFLAPLIGEARLSGAATAAAVATVTPGARRVARVE